jgi:signal transduction histidine kinase/ligand-binding sensor domain-containing protein
MFRVAVAVSLFGLSCQKGVTAAPLSLSRDFHHTQWTSENGPGAVFDVQQSREGYLWLTTSRGVFRFDGVKFQSLSDATYGAIDTNDIDSVYLSPSEGMWLATMSAGLLLSKDGRLTTFPDRRCTPTRKMGRLVEDRDGSLWVQGAAGLFRLRGSVCEQAGAELGYPGGFAAGLFMDSRGTVWVKVRAGPLLFLPRGESKFRVNSYGEGPSTSYAFLHEAPDGGIWLSDDQGLRRVEGQPGLPALAEPGGKPAGRKSQFGDFTFAPNGSLWAVIANGVERFDLLEPSTQGQIFTAADGLSSDAVWKVLIDREGTTWVATNSGLDRLRRTVLSQQPLPHAQQREFSIAAGDGGSVWTGNASLPLTHVTADGGLTSFLPSHDTITVRRDHTGTIWVAGDGQSHLWRSSGSEFTALHYPEENLDQVVSVAVDRNHDPWITTRSGRAYHLVNGTWSNQNAALGKKPGVIGAMADDAEGNIWFAFSERVVEWDGSGYHSFVRRGTRNISGTTMSVNGNHVWMGGPGGVQLFQGGVFSTMEWKDHGLPGRVSGLVETKTGDLWINGYSGITHVSSADLKAWLRDPRSAVSGEHLDELDGLPGFSEEKVPEPSVVEGTDSRIWFATASGIAWLDPKALEEQRNRLPPAVTVSGIVVNGKVYPGGSNLTLPKHTESLEIDYTALSLAVPERVRFRYKLDGVDKDWQDVRGRREAYYTKLRPGAYKFRVIASNNDGVWNRDGAALNLVLTPAWFQTGWFFALCGASALACVWLLYQLRLRRLAAMINARFEERLAERTRIAQELHDTLLQGFVSVSMHFEVATDQLPDSSPVKPMLKRGLQLIGLVVEEGRNAIRGLHLSRSASLDLEEAFGLVPREVTTWTEESPVEFRVIVNGSRQPLNPLLRDEIYRIGREALINAFRHANARHIEIELSYCSREFQLSVRDDGRGIDQETLRSGREGHWGLPGMRDRALRMGAQFRVLSSPGNGTEVSLTTAGHVVYALRPHCRRFPER